MVKQYIPVNGLNTSNSKVVGISINKHGKIRQLRVRKMVNSETSVVLTLSRKQLNPLDETLERLGL